MKIIVTGFKPFGAYPTNSSEAMLRQLKKQMSSEHLLVPILYPATIPSENRGMKLANFADDLDADAILSLGMASEKRGLCIESVAANLIDNVKYCPKELIGTRIDETWPYGSQIWFDHGPWNIPAFVAGCEQERIPVEYSNDAGGFCCNHLAYQALLALREREQRTPYLFLHLPCSPEAVPDQREFTAARKVSMSVEQMVRGIEILLQNVTF